VKFARLGSGYDKAALYRGEDLRTFLSCNAVACRADQPERDSLIGMDVLGGQVISPDSKPMEERFPNQDASTIA
jgi:hypothetical protein